MNELDHASVSSLSSKTLNSHLYILVFIIFLITFQEAQFLLYKYGRTEIVFPLFLLSYVSTCHPPDSAFPLLRKLGISKIYMLIQNLILLDFFYISFFILFRNFSNFLMKWNLKRYLFSLFPQRHLLACKTLMIERQVEQNFYNSSEQ